MRLRCLRPRSAPRARLCVLAGMYRKLAAEGAGLNQCDLARGRTGAARELFVIAV
jgi:hypothetical protein